MTTELEDETALLTELERLRPAEIIFPGENTFVREKLQAAFPIINGYDDWVFAPETALFTVREHFKVASLDGFGLKDRNAAIGAAGGVLHYLTQHLRRDVANLTRLSFYRRNDFLALDYTTLRHLESLEPLHQDAPRNACLYGALNRTVTPMGARRLRDWLSQPLAAVDPIRRRQEAVQALVENSSALESFRAPTRQHPPATMERTIGQLSSGSGNARDLLALRTALEQIPVIRQTFSAVGQASRLSPNLSEEFSISEEGKKSETGRTPALLKDLESQITEMPDLVELIARGIVDEPPLAIKEGGIIRDGFSAELDELRTGQRGGKDWIAKLQADEIASTGISSLKVRFNSVFGYYIEVTKSNLDKVPAHYVRKQTIANGERFITPELKEMEGKILGAEERSLKLEYELFQRGSGNPCSNKTGTTSIRTAAALAQLDVLGSFAEIARLFDYCRPHIGDDGVLHIRDGRHPVLEQNLSEERFVPNDTDLTGIPRTTEGKNGDRQDAYPTGPQIALITGPYMAGKSTYIRQVALLGFAPHHTGSFVPAAEARIGLIDRIFTRIGASDDLARGQSTFMVEMCARRPTSSTTPRAAASLCSMKLAAARARSTASALHGLSWNISITRLARKRSSPRTITN